MRRPWCTATSWTMRRRGFSLYGSDCTPATRADTDRNLPDTPEIAARAHAVYGARGSADGDSGLCRPRSGARLYPGVSAHARQGTRCRSSQRCAGYEVYLVRGELQMAYEQGLHLLHLAQRQQDPSLPHRGTPGNRSEPLLFGRTHHRLDSPGTGACAL